MWTTVEIESTHTNFKFGIKEKEFLISNGKFLELLTESNLFRNFYNKILATSDFEAFFWENNPFTHYNLEQDYKCNLINSDYLAKQSADVQTFNSYFKKGKTVVCFPNLGNDALLIAPCPQKDTSKYTHIGKFIRKCDENQVDDFWKMISEKTLSGIGKEPKWLSTSGLGVFWLHARIDSTPKYYQTEEYKNP